MDNRYKVIITSKRIFKEVELIEHGQPIRIGTTKNSNVRFSKEMFFEDFVISFTKMNDEWMVSCDDAVYLSKDGVMKLASKTLVHGDTFYVKYQNSNQELLKLEFMIDFDYKKKVYNLEIDTSNITSISIGGDKTYSIYIDDPLMKKTSVLLEKKNGMWHITDESSTYGVYKNGNKIKKEADIKDYDFFSIIGYSFYYKHGKLYTSSSASVIINDMPVKELGNTPGNKMYPRFNRNTRIKAVISEEKIPVLDPSTMPTKPKANLLLSLLPALAMLGVTVGLRSVIGNGGTYIIISACTMTIGVITSTVTIITGRKDYKKQMINRKEKYLAYIKRKRREIDAARALEKATLEDIYYSPEKERKMVNDFTGNLFERYKEDLDFLDVRLGTGAVKAAREIEYKVQERLEVEDELISIPEHLAQEYETIQKAPVVCKLAENNAVGVVGNNDSLYELFKTMILDIAIRQYQTDVKVFIIADEERSKQIMWTRFLPHIQNTDLNIRNIVHNDDSKTLLFEYLYKDLSQRENEKISEPRCVVFVLAEMGIKKHPVSRYIEKAKDYGYTFIFFENDQYSLPIGCNQVVLLDENTATGSLVNSDDRNNKQTFAYEVISEEAASAIVSKLAPVYSEEVSLESTLTKNISMFELLNIVSVEDLDLASRYRTSKVYKFMAAPLGVKAKGMVVSLDLHEKAHGPHGLVAGTTGSGKSEILQSYILSMATLFHPYEVSFMIIDFKGGGMVNQFRDLPHLVGAITNIDGREIDRSLKSIKAELQKRQKYFAAANVNHIDAYIKLYQKGEVKEPIPHLIVIVDEFAELKAEQPEFMKELISAARIGRSLGVHLILATQKPAGQVNEQIWSNSRFKLCLKVQTKEDSNEVIKSPLAAEIKEPGRSYFQVGNNEIFELFQSAYSGCPANTNDADDKKEYEIYQVGLDGRRSVVFSQKRNKSKESSQTQLTAIVDYVNDYCKKAGIKKPKSICLPPLPEKITFKQNPDFNTENIMATIGLYDDPDSQFQGDVSINITEQNTMIIGSSQYGKTNLLQTIIRSLASSYSPEQVNIYIIDFASMVLKNFEGLNHCGGVVCSSDDEKLKNLFKLLNSEIARRKEKLVEVGVSSFASYLEAGYKDISQIVLIVDNLSALKELYLQDNDVLLNICREGLSVGISVVIANAQTSGIGYRYLSNFSFKIGLYCNDNNEYSSIINGCRMKPRNTAGRCVLELNRSIYEAQTYLAFEGEKEIERVQEMKKFIADANQRYEGKKALYIPVIPKVLEDTFVSEQFGKQEKNYKLCIGLDYSNVSPYMLDLLSIGSIGITGEANSGKTNFITYMLQYLEANKTEMPSKVVIIDDFEKKLGKLKDLSVVSQYSIQADLAKEVISSFTEELKTRYEALMKGDDKVLDQAPLLLLIAKNNDVPAVISGDKEALAMYKQILAKYKALKVGFIYCNLPNAAIAYNAPDVMKMIKEAKTYVAFCNLGEVKLMDIPLSRVREFKKPVEQGDGYYIKENTIIKLKTPLVSKELS